MRKNIKYLSVIESLGTYVPNKKVSSEGLSTRLQNNSFWKERKLPLEKMTGIKNRHIVSKDETSYDLAKKAIINCLKKSEFAPKDIDMIISCNISKLNHKQYFQLAPSYAIQLKKELGFTKALVFDINNACAGSFTGIHILDSFIKSGRFNNGLIVSGEYISHITETALKEIRSQDDDRLACLTLGDAGVACILKRSTSLDEGFIDTNMFTEKGSQYCTAKPTNETQGGIIMNTNSKGIFESSVFNNAISIKQLIKKNNISFAKDIDHVIMHQVSERGYHKYLESINKYVKGEQITKDIMIKNVNEYGNTASTSHLLAFDTFLKNGKIKVGQTVLFAIQASGITIGSFLYKMKKSPINYKKNNKSLLEFKQEPINNRPKIKIKHIGINQDSSGIEQTLLAINKSINNASKADINSLIYTGMLKPDYIFEPAYASIISEDSGLNKGVDFFSYDITNSGLGWLNACMILNEKTRNGKSHLSLIVTSETENYIDSNAEASAIIESSTSTLMVASDDNSGFSHFTFNDYPEFLEDYTLTISCTGEQQHLVHYESKKYQDNLVQCIKKALKKFMKLHAMTPNDFKYILIPQLSKEFTANVSKSLGSDKIVNLNLDGDLLSGSIPFGLEHLSYKASKNDKTLIISFSPGIQIGIAIYTF